MSGTQSNAATSAIQHDAMHRREGREESERESREEEVVSRVMRVIKPLGQLQLGRLPSHTHMPPSYQMPIRTVEKRHMHMPTSYQIPTALLPFPAIVLDSIS